ncbi:MAG: D-aminoacyl-tRNA deacylase [Bacilli bacterium]|nr:D-aminoacyl-tRNA deacylase [Bacilli bacterium]MDY6362693.1 D-aminoacyl-tRNA deacylase [Bacilli bacterium]
MRIIVQNVTRASCEVNQKIVGSISRGFCLFVGFTNGDNKEVVSKMANKLLSLRLFDDENGKTNLSLKDVNGEILSISQFTLYASVKDGRRPSFVNALNPKEASELYDYFNQCLKDVGYKVETGIFGAMMKIDLVNDGPFTTILDSKELF